jgi:hypothetical protein
MFSHDLGRIDPFGTRPGNGRYLRNRAVLAGAGNVRDPPFRDTPGGQALDLDR